MTGVTRKLIRQVGVISADTYYRGHGLKGEVAVAALEAEVHARASKIAKQYGITRPHITTSWGLDVACEFTDYPMYLCGPNAPEIRTAKDVFTHVCHLDNPVARYQVVIRDQNEVDADDVRFYEERADQLERDGEAAFLEQWAGNVLEGARAVLRKRGLC